MGKSLAVRGRLLDGVLIAAFAVSSLYAAARIGLQPRNPENGVAVIFAPWTDASTAMTRAVAAGARFVRYGRFPFIVVVVPERAEFTSHILTQGAFLVADPQALAACLSVFPAEQVQ